LDTFARHAKTGELLPADLIQKINDMDNFDAGYMGLRQTYLGLLDMKWHANDPATIKDMESLEDELIAESWLFPRAAGPMSANFGHIFPGGYSSGYYSYKWAEVLDADIFETSRQKASITARQPTVSHPQSIPKAARAIRWKSIRKQKVVCRIRMRFSVAKD
jgi:peptidyl-dipeptidase Dcp